MKLTPVSGPHAIAQTATPEHVRTSRAVEAFNKGQSSYDKGTVSADVPVPVNANNISAEEMGAVRAQPQETEEIQEVDNTGTVEQTEVKEEKKVDPVLSRQFAQLARQEKALRAKQQQQDQQFRAREEALKARESELTGKTQSTQGMISLQDLKSNTLGKLAEAGITYEELTQQILNQQPSDPRTEALISRQEQRIAQLESRLEENSKNQVETQQQAYQSALNQIKSDAIALVKGDVEAYEAINKIGSRGINETVKLIEETYKKDGILLSVEEAANEIENYLVEENYNMSTNIKKIRNRILQANASNAGTKAQTPVQSKQQPQQMKTLTNAASSTRKLSARERALLAFKGEKF